MKARQTPGAGKGYYVPGKPPGSSIEQSGRTVPLWTDKEVNAVMKRYVPAAAVAIFALVVIAVCFRVHRDGGHGANETGSIGGTMGRQLGAGEPLGKGRQAGIAPQGEDVVEDESRVQDDAARRLSGPLTRATAIETARQAIAQHRIFPPSDTRVTVKLENDHYVVTFIYELPPGPGWRGPDYYAEVTIDARTGEVVEILGPN